MIGLLIFAAVAAEPPKPARAKAESDRQQVCVAPVAGAAGKRRAACVNTLELLRAKRPNDAQRVIPGLF